MKNKSKIFAIFFIFLITTIFYSNCSKKIRHRQQNNPNSSQGNASDNSSTKPNDSNQNNNLDEHSATITSLKIDGNRVHLQGTELTNIDSAEIDGNNINLQLRVTESSSETLTLEASDILSLIIGNFYSLIISQANAQSTVPFQAVVVNTGTCPENQMMKGIDPQGQIICEDNAASSSLATTAVVAFVDTQCPDGWMDYLPAYGRVIRGIDHTAAPQATNDPDGVRLPGSLQDDSFEAHTHNSYVRLGAEPHRGGPPPVAVAAQGLGSAAAGASQTFVPLAHSTGGPETRSKNVALLYCIRK